MGVLSSTNWTSCPPDAFDIVTAFFPETKPKGALRLRPCLVLNVLRNRNDGSFACRLAFGTKSLRLNHFGGVDLIIQNQTDLNVFGLPCATRFCLDPSMTETLPWSAEFFGCWSNRTTPIIGHLTEDYKKEYAYCMMQRSRPG